MDEISGPISSGFLSSAGLGVGILVGRAQSLPVPGLDKKFCCLTYIINSVDRPEFARCLVKLLAWRQSLVVKAMEGTCQTVGFLSGSITTCTDVLVPVISHKLLITFQQHPFPKRMRSFHSGMLEGLWPLGTVQTGRGSSHVGLSLTLSCNHPRAKEVGWVGGTSQITGDALNTSVLMPQCCRDSCSNISLSRRISTGFGPHRTILPHVLPILHPYSNFGMS